MQPWILCVQDLSAKHLTWDFMGTGPECKALNLGYHGYRNGRVMNAQGVPGFTIALLSIGRQEVTIVTDTLKGANQILASATRAQERLLDTLVDI